MNKLIAITLASFISIAACSANDPPATSPAVEPYPAASSGYRLVTFEGIALEVPAHWDVLDTASTKNLTLAGEAKMENFASGEGEQDKETVLAMNSTPSPHGAMIRVSRNNGMKDITSDAIYEASSSDLELLSAEFASMFKSIQPEFISISGVEKVAVSGRWALKISYFRRSFGSRNSGIWQVDQYLVPSDTGTVWQITLSRRTEDRIVWDPILERVKRTIRLH